MLVTGIDLGLIIVKSASPSGELFSPPKECEPWLTLGLCLQSQPTRGRIQDFRSTGRIFGRSRQEGDGIFFVFD